MVGTYTGRSQIAPDLCQTTQLPRKRVRPSPVLHVYIIDFDKIGGYPSKSALLGPLLGTNEGCAEGTAVVGCAVELVVMGIVVGTTVAPLPGVADGAVVGTPDGVLVETADGV